MGVIMLSIEDELWITENRKKFKEWKSFKTSLMIHIGIPNEKYHNFIVPDYWIKVHKKHKKLKK